MVTIAELICLPIKPEVKPHYEEKVTPLCPDRPLEYPEKAKASRKYECDVFNFLLKNKAPLGIETVFKFENLLIDGAILLADGQTRLAVEIKKRMNWAKACQAESQLKHFMMRTKEGKKNPVSGAIVFFEEFQGDGWERNVKRRKLQNGWNEWYEYYSKVKGRRVDLFRVYQVADNRHELEHYGLALENSKSGKNTGD